MRRRRAFLLRAVGAASLAIFVIACPAAEAIGAVGEPIVFAADRSPLLFGEVYRVGLGGSRVNLSRSSAADVAPAVSPDGRWVSFASDRGGYAAVYAVRTDGGWLHPDIASTVYGRGVERARRPARVVARQSLCRGCG